MGFKHLEGLLDEVSEDKSLALGVLDFVAQVAVVLLEEVHHWEDLTVVRHEGLTDSVTAGHEGLQDLQGDGDDLRVAGVKCSYTNQDLNSETVKFLTYS